MADLRVRWTVLGCDGKEFDKEEVEMRRKWMKASRREEEALRET